MVRLPHLHQSPSPANLSQIGALNITGCRALFMTPIMRKTPFLSLAAEAASGLSTSRPHEISDPALPSLRSLVVVDNLHDPQSYKKHVQDIGGASHMADVMVWREDGPEKGRVARLEEEGHKDDVINLQFTR